MGHVLYGSAVAGAPPSDLLDLESKEAADPRRRAILGFARKLTLRPSDVRRADVDALRAHLSERQIVGLVFAVCRYNTMNRLADGFGVPLERTNLFRRTKPSALAASASTPSPAQGVPAAPGPSAETPAEAAKAPPEAPSAPPSAPPGAETVPEVAPR